MSESLGLEVVAEKARICGLATLPAERAVVRKTKGAILVAMVGFILVNGNIRVLLYVIARSRC